MRKALRYGLIGAAALGAGLAILPFVVPAGLYKDRIEESVGRATGRKFAISGSIRFTLFPALGLRARGVSLANPPGFRADALASADGLRIGLRLWPLLSGRLDVTEIVLEQPRIALEVDAKGRGDWVFARATRAASAGGGPRAATRIPALKIVQGSVTYFNARSRSARRIDGIDAVIAADALDRPAVLAGVFVYAARPVGFRAKISTPLALFQDRTAGIDLALASGLLQAAFAGSVAPDGRIDGRLTLDAPALRPAAGWLGVKLPSAAGFDSLSLSADFKGDNRHAELTGLRATLDGAAFAGTLRLLMGGPVLDIEGALTADRLDLNPYLVPPARHGPAPKPTAHADGWSRDPIALDMLGRIDARLNLDAGRVSIRHLKLGRTSIKVGLRDGALMAILDPVALYGGKGKAMLRVTAGKVPAFASTLEFDDVALQPLLTDTIGVAQIAGTGTIKLNVTSRGQSADAIMHGLDGGGSIAFRNGQLRGVDLGETARKIQAVLGAVEGKGAFTDYAAMGGSFTIADGVLTSKDFRLAGPLIQATGSGNVDIAGRAIDFKMVPKATASIARIKLTLGVPFHIVGPWRHVRYKADLAGAAGVLLENLLGRKDANADPNAPKKKHKSLGQALKNMLGIH